MYQSRLLNFVDKHEKLTAFFLMAVILFIFNIVAVFWLEVMIHDDPGMFNRVVIGRFPRNMQRFNLLDPYVEWFFWNIMVISPKLARLCVLFLVLIPSSFLFYYLFRNQLGFSRTLSFCAAVIPHMLPYNFQIPSGVNMSYPAWGLLVYVSGIILGLIYLKREGLTRWWYFSGTLICIVCALMLTEQNVFLFPAAFFLFAFATQFSRKNALILTMLSMATCLKLLKVLQNPRKPLVLQPFDVIVERIGLWFKWSLPVPDISPYVILNGILLLLAVGFFLALRSNTLFSKAKFIFSHLKKSRAILYIYIFFILWATGSIFIMIFFSIPYQPRYTYISAFGLNVLFLISLYVFAEQFFNKWKYSWYILISIVLIYSGTARSLNLEKKFRRPNKAARQIHENISNLRFTKNAQIVLLGINYLSGGYYRSSGHLKHLLKRKDVTGLISRSNMKDYYNFCNHFDKKLRGWKKKDSVLGLSRKYPVFCYKYDRKKDGFRQYEYLLNWEGNDKNSAWKVFRMHPDSGELALFEKGQGYGAYQKRLDIWAKQGLKQEDIVWGGPATPKELKRLGL